MTRLVYEEAELLAEHPYVRPQIEAGYRLHGGFDAAGRYLSPRTLKRWPAVRAWQAELERRGFPLVDVSTGLLERGTYPTFAQQKLLLDLGLGQTLWDALTVTGVIEARGRWLAELSAPPLQAIIDEDISGTTIGHLGKGLLKAHGFDEGGRPEEGQGGHDTMWFAARDLLFGKDAYPLPRIPDSLARPELGRLLPQLPAEHEQLLMMLMNVLMIEVRADAFFAFCTQLMRDPALFAERRAAADQAAILVERINQDEAIHTAYLQTAISELRSFTFRTWGGKRVRGDTFIDPIWHSLVHWHAITRADHARVQTRDYIRALLLAAPNGAQRLAAFDALEPREAA